MPYTRPARLSENPTWQGFTNMTGGIANMFATLWQQKQERERQAREQAQQMFLNQLRQQQLGLSQEGVDINRERLGLERQQLEHLLNQPPEPPSIQQQQWGLLNPEEQRQASLRQAGLIQEPERPPQPTQAGLASQYVDLVGEEYGRASPLLPDPALLGRIEALQQVLGIGAQPAITDTKKQEWILDYATKLAEKANETQVLINPDAPPKRATDFIPEAEAAWNRAFGGPSASMSGGAEMSDEELDALLSQLLQKAYSE